MHSSCFATYSAYNYTCPLCCKSVGDMSVYFQMLDSLLAAERLPPEYSGRMQQVRVHRGSLGYSFNQLQPTHSLASNQSTPRSPAERVPCKGSSGPAPSVVQVAACRCSVQRLKPPRVSLLRPAGAPAGAVQRLRPHGLRAVPLCVPRLPALPLLQHARAVREL
jgi:hypothetical protein